MQTVPLSQALAGLKIVDLGRGLAAGVTAKLMAELGATVSRFCRSDDPFVELYPAYRLWHRRAELRLTYSPDDAAITAALAEADVCIAGGEDFPGYAWHPDAAAIAARHPHLVVLELQGYPEDDASAGRPAVELLVQARSGICWEQYSERPIRLSFELGGYAASLAGIVATMGALCQRERDGTGQIVRTSLYEGVLTLATQYWYSAERPSGSFNIKMPIDPHPLIFKCRDGRYIHFVLGSFGSKGRVYRILEIDDPSVGPDDSGMPTGKGDPKNFFGDVDVLAAHVAKFDSPGLVARIRAAGVAVNYVLPPGACWDDDPVAHIGLIDTAPGGERHVGLPMHGNVTPFDPSKRLHPKRSVGALPLRGVRMVDFGIFVAGPFASVSLVDLGAEVIKVETPQGDPNRSVFRSFAAVNRGKRGIALDMKTADGMAIAARLAASAQILHNNFRPGVSARLGVDPASQHAIDPDKVVLESSGYGRTGKSAQEAGFDMVFQAYCGHEIRAGGVGNPPMWDRSSMVDYFNGLLSAATSMIGVWRRFKGAGGADLELSLLDAGLYIVSELVGIQAGFVGAPALNRMQTGFHPAEALYRCADGWIAIAARGEKMAVALSTELGFEARPPAMWSEAEAESIAGGLREVTTEQALARLEQAGVWAEPCVRGGERMLTDPGTSAGLVLRRDHPLYGEVAQIGALFRLGAGRPTSSGGAPVIGAHTREILAELGYDDAEIEDFYARKIVA